jgi:hypothetical protein
MDKIIRSAYAAGVSPGVVRSIVAGAIRAARVHRNRGRSYFAAIVLLDSCGPEFLGLAAKLLSDLGSYRGGEIHGFFARRLAR